MTIMTGFALVAHLMEIKLGGRFRHRILPRTVIGIVTMGRDLARAGEGQAIVLEVFRIARGGVVGVGVELVGDLPHLPGNDLVRAK